MTAAENGFNFDNDCSSTVNNFANKTGYLATWCDCRVRADLIYNLDTGVMVLLDRSTLWFVGTCGTGGLRHERWERCQLAIMARIWETGTIDTSDSKHI